VRQSANSKSANRTVVGKSIAQAKNDNDHSTIQMLGLSAKPAWAQTWHLWMVIIPRRSITGRLVVGNVWRRHDGRRWIYKRFAEDIVEGGVNRKAPHARREES
jgi:hypothetical protein